MLEIMKKFFAFCNEKERRQFKISIVLGVFKAFFDALKIPAIWVMLKAVLDKNVTTATILLSLGIVVLGVIGNAVLSYSSQMLQTEGGYNTCAQKRIEIAEHLRYLPMGYFNKNSLGYITSVATNTMENLADVATRVIMMVTKAVLASAMVVLMICIFDIRIGIVSIIGMALYFLINSFMQKQSIKISPKKDAADSRLVEKVIEYLHGISEVKAYNLVGKKSRQLDDAVDVNTKANTDMEMTFIPFMTLQNIFSKLLGVVICVMSIIFCINGTMTLLNCIVMIICSFIVFGELEAAGSYSSLMRGIELSVNKGNGILSLPTIDIDGEDIKPANFDIDLKNVSFSYDDRKIIDGVSLHIPEKTTTAIVGPSGGGKTTLCHLISRFWDVDGGEVLLGGKNVKDYSIDSLMKNFSFVFQNVYLFNDTIANNIRFGQPDAPMEKVIKAAKQACCHDFIMKLPEGYDTVIGEGGASLSGGEKQRLSIARAIMKDAPVIILDEATANVDPENEKELVEAIDALTREKTIIMIAHRLKTVRNADQILVIDKGHIAQRGTHDELMNKDGIYRNFVNSRELAIGWKV